MNGHGRGEKMRGEGAPSTSTSNMFVMYNINDLPIVAPLEKPLWPKRQRKWSPPRAIVRQPSPDISTPEAEVKIEVDPLNEFDTDIKSPAVPQPIFHGTGGKMRGGGASSTSTSNMLVMYNINDLPIGVPLEKPLWPKRQRKWSPPRAIVRQPSPDISTQEVEVKIEVDPLNEFDTDVNSPTVPQPALFIACGTHSASGKETPVCSGTRIPAVKGTWKHPRRSLDLETEIKPGSESDSDVEELEGAMLVDSTSVRRVELAALDTPLDKVVPAVDETIGDTEEAVVGPNNFYNFQWTPFPNPPIPPESRRETFSQSNVGPVTSFENPYDVFAAIWDPQIMEHIAKETNRYAEQLAQLKILNNDLYPGSRISEWRELTADDIWVYFALVLAMGIVVKSRVDEYWSADADIFETPGFRIHMSLRKFQLISSCLHFNNNEDMCTLNLSPSEAKLYKIQPILEHLQQKFQTMYVPKQNIALDESLLMWKGWLDINQFISFEAAAIGIKTYEICECQTGYLWRFEVHANKSTPLAQDQEQNPMEASTPAVVLRLTHGLENKGYTLWMNNHYSSLALARKLKNLGFDCVGTLRTNRQFVPQQLNKLTKANMTSGQITGYTSGDVDIMVWKDLNRVAMMISTYHGNATALVDGKQKPILILDYTVMMGGVDKKDHMLAMYPIERKQTKVWYKKLFRRLLNVSVLNSYIILKQSPLIASSSFTLHRNFRTTLIQSILDKHSSAPISVPPSSQNKFDIKSHHLAEFGFLPGHSARQRRQCAVCKKRVHLFCEGCQKPFCMNPCFVSYHS